MVFEIKFAKKKKPRYSEKENMEPSYMTKYKISVIIKKYKPVHIILLSVHILEPFSILIQKKKKRCLKCYLSTFFIIIIIIST